MRQPVSSWWNFDNSTSSSPSFIGGITGFWRVSFLFPVFLVIVRALYDVITLFVISYQSQYESELPPWQVVCECRTLWHPGLTTAALLKMASPYQSLLPQLPLLNRSRHWAHTNFTADTSSHTMLGRYPFLVPSFFNTAVTLLSTEVMLCDWKLFSVEGITINTKFLHFLCVEHKHRTVDLISQIQKRILSWKPMNCWMKKQSSNVHWVTNIYLNIYNITNNSLGLFFSL